MARTNNPKGIAALVMVDVSPRWVYGHTALDPGAAQDEDALEMACVSKRIGLLAYHAENLGVEVIAVESTSKPRLDVSDLRGKNVALCGLYGGQCVQDVADWLEAQGVRVTQIHDCILWPPDEEETGIPAAALFPGIQWD